MNEIEKFVSEKNYSEAIQECLRTSHNHLGILLSHAVTSSLHRVVDQLQANISGIETEGKVVEETVNLLKKENPPILSEDDETSLPPLEEVPAPTLVTTDSSNSSKPIRVKLLCHFADSGYIRNLWNKMSQGNYTWNNIQIVLDNDPDYFVVINAPPQNENPDPAKTIVFRMEPYMDTKNKGLWGAYANPDPKKFFRVCSHDNDYNNNEWWLSKTYSELQTFEIKKTEDVLSTVLSAKYSDPGHIKRIDFVKFMEKKGMPVHVYGDDKWGYKDFKGSLPSHEKDTAMFPYKYVFNCENNSIKNYYTEKLIDGILAECLVFYSGCYNVRDFIDEKAFVYLELSNFEEDYKKVKAAIESNLWEERLPYIKKAKKKIMEYLQFYPRLERIINKTEGEEYKS